MRVRFHYICKTGVNDIKTYELVHCNIISKIKLVVKSLLKKRHNSFYVEYNVDTLL